LVKPLHAEKGMASGSKRDQVAEDTEEAARRAQQELLDLLGDEAKTSKEDNFKKKKAKKKPKKGSSPSVESASLPDISAELDGPPVDDDNWLSPAAILQFYISKRVTPSP
jgi:hypothetical protein